MTIIDITQPPFNADNKYHPTKNPNAPSASCALQKAIQFSQDISDISSADPKPPNKMSSLKIIIPYGNYKFDETVRINRSVIIEGEGKGQFSNPSFGATQIFPAAGVTPFQFWQGGNENIDRCYVEEHKNDTPPKPPLMFRDEGMGAHGSEIRDLHIIANSRYVGFSSPRKIPDPTRPDVPPDRGIKKWEVGDILFNRNPKPGDPAAWSCIEGGDPGKWSAWANISTSPE